MLLCRNPIKTGASRKRDGSALYRRRFHGAVESPFPKSAGKREAPEIGEAYGKMSQLANILTGLRIGICAALWLVRAMGPAFWGLYALGGLTDMLDGAVARWTHSESRLGAALDSAADMAFCATGCLRLLPSLAGALPEWSVPAVLGIALIRLMAYGVGAWRYRRLVARHTISNKLMGLALFAAPLLMAVCEVRAVCAVLAVAGALSALEELLINACAKDCDPNVRCVISALRSA